MIMKNLIGKETEEENIGIQSSTNYDTKDEIVKLIKSIPNDMELGRAVRELFS